MELGPQLRAAPAAYSWGVSIAPVEQEVTESSGDLAPDVPWITLVWNDPVNLMSYVTYVFQSYFGYSREKAEKLMMDVHTKGRAVVSTSRRRGAWTRGRGVRHLRVAASPRRSPTGAR